MADADRKKALDIALAQIDKQFGKGSLMKLGESGAQKVAAIPSGALSLDLALGIGGLPRGRVVEIYGPESSGKCIVAGTYVWTDHGLETVEELFARCGQPATCTSRITDVSALGVRAVNEHARLEPVAALTHNNRQPVLRLTVRSGRSVEVTANHPLRVLSGGWIVWKEAGEIAEGDVVVSALFGAAEAEGASGLGEDEAVLLGYLVSEGTLSGSTPTRFAFSNANDPDVVAEVTRLCRDLLGVEPRRHGIDYHFNSKAARETLRDRYGLDYGVSADKTIPYGVRTAGAKVQAAFLSALYEGDGWIEKGPEVGYTSASRTLAEQLQLLLYGLGIPATLSAKRNKAYERDYYTVLVGPAGVQRFLDTVGFRSARRAEQVAGHAATVTTRSSVAENIPGLWPVLRTLRDMLGGDRAFDRLAGDLRRDGHTDCSRRRLQAIVSWADERLDHAGPSARALVEHLRFLATSDFAYERVVAVEDAGEQPTFDLMVPDTHSFVANGILSHNTTVALHVIAEAQKLGGIAAFIDAEHALDPVYAKAIGVDIDELLVSQPDTGEQALEIADMLVRSGAVDIIVIDSVAALVPRVELEGEMGDTHVGLQARLMSQALRKLSGNLNRSKTCCVFINQLREKVGIMFGSPETTSGGRALKFYSSVRLDVRRIETLKDGADAVGNRVRVKVVKNKCLAAGSRVFDPTTGLTHRIEDIVDNEAGAAVWATDKTGQLHVRPITARLNQGEQEVIGLRLRDGSILKVTADHRVMTEHGWREAGALEVGDRVARPRRAGGFGEHEPVPPHHARLLGYLIGDGSLNAATPIAFVNKSEELQEDAARIAAELGCTAHRNHPSGIYTSFSTPRGQQNPLLDLVRWAGIWGHLAPEKKIHPAFFGADVSAEVVGNLLMGIWESDGWLSREQTGGLRLGFATTSEQLAWQIHWLLLRWGISSSVRTQAPMPGGVVNGRRIEGRVPRYQVRVSGIDNVRRFAEAIPMWGPKGRRLTEELANPALAKHRGARTVYLSAAVTEPVVSHLRSIGVTPTLAAGILGLSASQAKGGLRMLLGMQRLRRDRVEVLADAFDSQFLRDVLADELCYERIHEVLPPQRCATYDVEVEDLHNLVADGVVVHNCSAPFKQAEFDVLYGEGISREGTLIDVGVEAGIIKKSGAWYTYEGEQLGQGRENVRSFLKENVDVALELSKRIREHLGIDPITSTEEAEALDAVDG